MKIRVEVPVLLPCDVDLPPAILAPKASLNEWDEQDEPAAEYMNATLDEFLSAQGGVVVAPNHKLGVSNVRVFAPNAFESPGDWAEIDRLE